MCANCHHKIMAEAERLAVNNPVIKSIVDRCNMLVDSDADLMDIIGEHMKLALVVGSYDSAQVNSLYVKIKNAITQALNKNQPKPNLN